jgi:hypothetical protein
MTSLGILDQRNRTNQSYDDYRDFISVSRWSSIRFGSSFCVVGRQDNSVVLKTYSEPSEPQMPAGSKVCWAWDSGVFMGNLCWREVAWNTSLTKGLTRVSTDPTLADLIYRHRVYLQRITSEGEISQELRDAAWEVLTRILEVSEEDAQVPDAIPGVDGKLFYTWRSFEHYLDLEMRPNGTAEFFFRHRVTGTYSSFPWRLDWPIPGAVIQKLRHFRRSR